MSMTGYVVILGFVGLVAFLFALGGFRVIPEFERSVHLRFGRYIGVLNPGLRWIIPVIDTVQRVDMRQRTLDLPSQDVLSKDNVNLTINGALFYIINNPKHAFLNVANLKTQLSQKATSELKEILGSMDMNDAMSKRKEIATTLRNRMNTVIQDEKTEGGTKDWGVTVKDVQINDIQLPKELIRAMAKEAEATREKNARIIKAQGELEASKKLKTASEQYNDNPSALRLRELQTYQEIGSEQNSLIIVTPQSTDNLGLAALGNIVMGRKLKKRRR